MYVTYKIAKFTSVLQCESQLLIGVSEVWVAVQGPQYNALTKMIFYRVCGVGALVNIR
jgi:hypothetical protein